MPATVEAAVVAKLKATSAVNTPTGGRIHATLDTQDEGTPQIIITKQGAEGGSRLDGGRALKRYSVQVDIYGDTEAATLTIGKAVRDALAPDGSSWSDDALGVKGSFFEDSSASYTEDGLRLQSESFGIWFQPT